MIFAQWLLSGRYGTEKMGAHLIKFADITGHMNQPHIPSSGVFVRSLERSRLRLISIRASCVNYKVNHLRQHRLSLFHTLMLLWNKQNRFLTQFPLYPFLNYALYISEVTIVTKACFILNVYVYACVTLAFFPFSVSFICLFKRQNAQ